MVSESDSGSSVTTGEERTPNTFFNALIGAVVSVVLGFIPFSPVLGGGIAGYLEGGDSGDGAKVGAISGVLAAIPLIAVVLLVSAIVIIAPEGGALGLSFLILVLVIGVVIYAAGLSVIGGVLGVYLKKET